MNDVYRKNYYLLDEWTYWDGSWKHVNDGSNFTELSNVFPVRNTIWEITVGISLSSRNRSFCISVREVDIRFAMFRYMIR